MKGNNVFLLNEATMIEAVQYWMISQFVGDKAPKIIGIKQQPSPGSYNSSGQFEVSVKSEETV